MKWLLALAFGAVGTLASAWALMLLFGVLHHELSPTIPAIGFGPSLIISLTYGLWAGIRKGFTEATEDLLEVGKGRR